MFFSITVTIQNWTKKVSEDSYQICPIKKFMFHYFTKYSANIYMFKVNDRNTRKMCDKCSKLTTKTPKRRQWRRFVVVIVNFVTFYTPFPGVSNVDFEQVNIWRVLCAVNLQK